ncbi:MAG TPA: hypothetical protein P5053_10930, partial [Bacteroidia bacterium]|nr:hypothetical protein [Bacteroidia bacterium]
CTVTGVQTCVPISKSGAVAELQGFCEKNTTPCTFKKSNNTAGVWRFFLQNPQGLTLQERGRLIFALRFY